MPKAYTFSEQLRIGKAAERQLDAYFSQWYTIEVLPREIEMMIHSDRLFIDAYGKQTVVEYKADYLGHKSGRVYIETLSVDIDNRPGWVYSSMADVLVYWIVGSGELYSVRPRELREHVPQWEARYPKVKAHNEMSSGAGILVPIREIAELSIYNGVLYDPAFVPAHSAMQL